MYSQTSSVSVVEKFNGKSKFSLWRIKVRALLKQQGIYAPLAGPKPADMTESKYNSQDEKAHSTIFLSLLDEVPYEVADEEMTVGVVEEGSALKYHLDVLNSILMDLKNVEVKIDDEGTALILLVSLPPLFENLVNSFVVGKDTIALEDVRSILHSQELRHQASGTSESQLVGLSATGQDRGRNRTQKGKGKGRYKDRSKSRPRGTNPQDTCNYCKEEGYWKFNCPKIKEKGQVAAVAKDDSRSERDVFDDGHVFMGNDSPCKVVDLKKNLISLGVLDSKGFKYTSENGVLRVSNGALVVMKETKGTSSLYTLQGETITVILSKRGLLDKVANLEFCEHCVITKQKRVSFSKVIHLAKATLDYLHADCWGPSRVPSLDGFRYFLSIIDDLSRMTWVFMMKHKSEVFDKFKHWKILIENQTGRKIKRLRTDNCLEFCSREFNDFCRDEGIARHYTVRYTPQQNGVAERMNRTLLEGTQCLLLNARLDISVWAEALKTDCYLINSRDVTFDKDYLFRVKQDPIESKLQEGVFKMVDDVPKNVEHVIPGDSVIPRQRRKHGNATY
ncbi:retrovirus-related pol polyprotein from transposon TNT 1-94 [Tanacetum coccineum]